jgi:ribose 5-phosphate isomerase RpiB
MLDLVRAFVAARFTGEERHRRRLAKIARWNSLSWRRSNE